MTTSFTPHCGYISKINPHILPTEERYYKERYYLERYT
jgi:hypothetical protein